jgi:hypothetical protein
VRKILYVIVRSDPQRLFGAVSRKNTDDEIARDIIAGYMGDVPVEERIEFLGLALWAMRLALKHPDRFQVLSGLCLLHDCLTWTRREWLRRFVANANNLLAGNNKTVSI